MLTPTRTLNKKQTTTATRRITTAAAAETSRSELLDFEMAHEEAEICMRAKCVAKATTATRAGAAMNKCKPVWKSHLQKKVSSSMNRQTRNQSHLPGNVPKIYTDLQENQIQIKIISSTTHTVHHNTVVTRCHQPAMYRTHNREPRA